MSLQWSLVASFLYVEIAFVILLLLPIIPARTWQKFFKSRFLKSIESQANIWFMGFLLILILMFVDSIREMGRYSAGREAEHGHLDSELQYSMKLFRAQRNFYIAGFALFLCLVIRRLVLLIQAQASLLAERDAALKQAKGASDAAQSLMKGNNGDTREESAEVKKLRQDLDDTKDQLVKLTKSEAAVKKQAANLTAEYDNLSKEHAKLQKKYETLTSSESSKDK